MAADWIVDSFLFQREQCQCGMENRVKPVAVAEGMVVEEVVSATTPPWDHLPHHLRTESKFTEPLGDPISREDGIDRSGRRTVAPVRLDGL